MLYERILRFIIFDNTVYSLFNYLVTAMAIFVTIYNYRAHNYFITIVMKFRNYFPSSINNIIFNLTLQGTILDKRLLWSCAQLLAILNDVRVYPL